MELLIVVVDFGGVKMSMGIANHFLIVIGSGATRYCIIYYLQVPSSRLSVLNFE